jgi:tetratricopeptide (TPR) repeat protein
MNSPELAWQLFNQALSVDKGNVDMRVRLAAALARAGKFREALQYISHALEIDPNDKNSLELGRHIVKALEKQGTVAAND